MENYKQKYERALKQAKKELEACGSLDCDAARQIFRLFPELKKNENEMIREELIHFLETCQDTRFVGNRKRDKWIEWLEKQNKQEQLYIRFGEIPTDEKSKIYQGEIEVGTENGVSAYPAFKTDKGDIVLGLSLPITKTTLYTQQHLIEYDDRPCYLVKGDYVGKDADGQPLINNINIIENIDSYRVKEEKQDNSTEKVKPKFKAEDWIINSEGMIRHIVDVDKTGYQTDNGWLTHDTYEREFHLWTIQDAKDGDVLATDKSVFIYAKILHNKPYAYCGVDKYGVFKDNCLENNWANSVDNIHPATIKQCDFLFQKIEGANYKWDSNKKELTKYEQ